MLSKISIGETRLLVISLAAFSLTACNIIPATVTPASRSVMLETGRVSRRGEVGAQGHVAYETNGPASDGDIGIFGGHVRVGVADSVEASLSGQAVNSQPTNSDDHWVGVGRWGMTYRLGFRFQVLEGPQSSNFRPSFAIGLGAGGSYVGDRGALGGDVGFHFSLENRIFTPFFLLSMGIAAPTDGQPRVWLTRDNRDGVDRLISVPIRSALAVSFLVGGRLSLYPDCDSVCPALLIAGGFRGNSDLDGQRQIQDFTVESSSFGWFAQGGIEFLFRT